MYSSTLPSLFLTVSKNTVWWGLHLGEIVGNGLKKGISFSQLTTSFWADEWMNKYTSSCLYKMKSRGKSLEEKKDLWLHNCSFEKYEIHNVFLINISLLISIGMVKSSETLKMVHILRSGINYFVFCCQEMLILFVRSHLSSWQYQCCLTSSLQ